MIDLTIYLATIAILSAIIIAFVIHSLREPRIKSMTSELKKQNDTLITEKTKAQAIIRDLTEKISEQQEQISKQAATLSIPTQYTFDRVMGFLKSRSEGKPYCTACLLEFKEIQLDTNRKPAQCPKCGAEYPVQARFILLSP